MATDQIRYISYPEAILLHFAAREMYGEMRYGVFDRSLIESALARPQHAAVYENADLVRQAATLYFGLIKNHPWAGGNKRTATTITEAFLVSNGLELNASITETINLVLAIEADEFSVDEIEMWLRAHIIPTRFTREDEKI